jgi:hypothetical protein
MFVVSCLCHVGISQPPRTRFTATVRSAYLILGSVNDLDLSALNSPVVSFRLLIPSLSLELNLDGETAKAFH